MFKHHTTNPLPSHEGGAQLLPYSRRCRASPGLPPATADGSLRPVLHPGQGDALSPLHHALPVRNYFVPDKYGYDWKIKEDGAEDLYEAIAPLMLPGWGPSCLTYRS